MNIGELAKRTELRRRLDRSAERTFPKESKMTDYTILPDGLPVPEDDGAADHLPGTPLPPLALADALRLPTFAAPGHDRLYSRLTLVVRDGAIEHVFYPIFPPNTHAQQVLDWLAHHPAPESAQEQ